jgi:GT2 family glycosyltransferase/ubiquinone/menaquinone biosynthesis C-methylase UbiE
VNETTSTEQPKPLLSEASTSDFAPDAIITGKSRRLPDGNFAVPRAIHPLPFTGERMTTGMDGQIAFEHLHRYCIGRDLCVGKDVLDVASGEGYGSALLAGVAHKVVGVEIDSNSVRHARTAYVRSNLSFLQGDAHALPLADASFDVILSFETLEHLSDQECFLKEVRRVLRPSGLLLLSTPDRHVYSAPGQPVNPYHVLELSRPEFAALLGSYFANHRILQQRTFLGSLMVPLDVVGGWRSYDRRADDILEAMPEVSRAFYLIAVASDGLLPPVGGSMYSDNRSVDDMINAAKTLPRITNELGQAQQDARNALEAQMTAQAARALAEAELQQLREKAQTAAAELQKLRGKAQIEKALAEEELRTVRTEGQSAVASTYEELLQAKADGQAMQRATDEELQHLREVEADLTQQLVVLKTSTWWRIGGPLRFTASKFPKLSRQGRRALKLSYWIATGRLFERIRQIRTFSHSESLVPKLLPIDDLHFSATHAEQNDAAPAAHVVPGLFHFRAQLGLPSQIDYLPQSSQLTIISQGLSPVVSIIIPTFGKVEYTLRCLASLAAASPNIPIEIIVVDDGSKDPQIVELRAVRGIRLFLRPFNLGFLRNCNEAAALAHGEFIMFLNNDTEVMPGTVDSLYELLIARPDAGITGARLLYPDGYQQEAGGIIWRDGSAWNYGHRDDPSKPEYNYVREADYISGAAIMLRRSLWNRLGGFDELFLPAYCEDSDLAFRVRSAGLKVLYQPEARVVHYEGVSHGTDISAGVKSHQPANLEKLANRWRRTLRRFHFPVGTQVMRARDRAAHRTVTLVIDHYVPEPDRDAGSRTIVAFMEALVASGRVVKFFPANGFPTPGYTTALQQRGIEVLYSPWSGTFAEWIITNGKEIDEILLSRPQTAAEYIPLLEKHCRAPIVFYGHDLHHVRMRREFRVLGDSNTTNAADAMEALERATWRAVDFVLYPSEEEVATVRALEPSVAVRTISAYALPPLPCESRRPPSSAHLIFVGGFRHGPNVDAVLWLIHDILPRIRAVRPETTLTLVGSNPPQEISDLAGDGLEVTGYVPDEELAGRYSRARVAVCPLRFGAGVKLKVVEAMYHRVPLVVTPVGAQGLEGIGEVCDVCEEAAEFAAEVLRLLDDDVLWASRAEAQAAYVATRFSASEIRRVLIDAFESVSSMNSSEPGADHHPSHSTSAP